jgi:hypothetical protein
MYWEWPSIWHLARTSGGALINGLLTDFLEEERLIYHLLFTRRLEIRVASISRGPHKNPEIGDFLIFFNFDSNFGFKSIVLVQRSLNF